ncbi:MAG: circularly permuted type 2 ATP-grasp protein [SAR324 cluster bacterium]|nr:circularly permuted type 2 ATP-grasp protein [SAR324 cluster bacterium]
MPDLTMNMESSFPAIWNDYAPSGAVFDELLTTKGEFRPHWQFLMQTLQKMGPQEFQNRKEAIHNQLQQDGVTYMVYEDSKGIENLWGLDPIPALIPSEEWGRLELGLIQRAEVLDKLLMDLYSDQQVISKRLLPPELVFANPGFLRPCSGTLSSKRALVSYAADLVRQSDGNMYVLGDRAQTPSGSGYALANRVTISRIMPSLFRDAQVHRLEPYFRTLRNSLKKSAPRETDDPFVVILSPGPGHQTYFEHAYLANYLGVFLVQGGDLVFKDQCLWFRSLKGLQKVDVLMRRVNGDYCDPLELRSDSLLGVPGMLQAVRSGNLTVINPLGAGVLQNPALSIYLPALSQYFLGEELLLPSVPTFWCGDARHRQHVLSHLDNMVIKPIYPQLAEHYVFGRNLSSAKKQQWIERIQRQPHLFVGQEQITFSTIPFWQGNRMEARHMGLRSFLVSDGRDYAVMPGGLTRVAPKMGDLVVSNHHRGFSKDTWILASEPERPVSLFSHLSYYTASVRHDRRVSYRVADNLFWLGRYAQRSESMIRWLRQVVLLRMGSQIPDDDPSVIRILQAATSRTELEWMFLEFADQKLTAPESGLRSILLDEQMTGSLSFNIKAMTRVARAVQDQLSEDIWYVCNRLNFAFSMMNDPVQVLESLNRMKIAFAALRGISTDSMSQGMGWRFWDIGRRIEWALNTMTLLHSALRDSESLPESFWEFILDMEDLHVIYRDHYSFTLNPIAILELILKNADNPRAVQTQLMILYEHISQLQSDEEETEEKQLILEALSMLKQAQLDPYSENMSPRETFNNFQYLLNDLTNRLYAFSDAITRKYLMKSEPSYQLQGEE